MLSNLSHMMESSFLCEDAPGFAPAFIWFEAVGIVGLVAQNRAANEAPVMGGTRAAYRLLAVA